MAWPRRLLAGCREPDREHEAGRRSDAGRPFPYGRMLPGIRDNEPRMRALGYRTAVARYGCSAWPVPSRGGGPRQVRLQSIQLGQVAPVVTLVAERHDGVTSSKIPPKDT